MGRFESSSEKFCLSLVVLSGVFRPFLWGWGQDPPPWAPLACSVSAVHCGFTAVTSISKFSISSSAWRVSENNCGTGFVCSLLFGVSVCLGLVGPASFPHSRGVCVCIVCVSACLSQPSQGHHWNGCCKETQNYLAFTSSSISISHNVLDPGELAIGETWQAFQGFGWYFLCFHNYFLILLSAKLKFGTCKLLLILVPQQVHYACVR